MPGKVYLIPSVLHDDEYAYKALPAYILDAVKKCTVFFAENERTARRFFKHLWKEMVIDDYTWYTIHNAEEAVHIQFQLHVKKGDVIGIVSEAGCPCIADPGRLLVDEAQRLHAQVIPLVGPNSILLALMASGMNGQCFQFAGYLPVDADERKKMIRELEQESVKRNCTQIFIETPYRNNQLIKDVLFVCRSDTKFCIAADLTSANESIKTMSVKEWQQSTTDYHKKPVIFLLYPAE